MKKGYFDNLLAATWPKPEEFELKNSRLLHLIIPLVIALVLACGVAGAAKDDRITEDEYEPKYSSSLCVGGITIETNLAIAMAIDLVSLNANGSYSLLKANDWGPCPFIRVEPDVYITNCNFTIHGTVYMSLGRNNGMPVLDSNKRSTQYLIYEVTSPNPCSEDEGLPVRRGDSDWEKACRTGEPLLVDFADGNLLRCDPATTP